MIYRFGEFTLDTARCQLLRNGEEVALRAKSFDLLGILLQAPRQVVGKDTFLTRLWPDVTVTEASLTQCIAELRHALSPDGGALIRTVPRRGYMLDTEVVTDAPDTSSSGPGTRVQGGRLFLVVATAAGMLVGALLYHAAWALLSMADAHPSELLTTGTTALGQPLVWPEGAPRLVAGITTIAPGTSSTWHRHDAPLFAYILDGSIETDYGPEGTRRYAAGDALVEAVDLPHRATNTGFGTARILYVLIGTQTSRLRISADAPVN